MFFIANNDELYLFYQWSFRSTAVVIVAFVASGDMRILLEELSQKPSTPRQWIGSEAWVTDPDMLRFTFCAGAVGFGIQQTIIPGLREFLLDLTPAKILASSVLTEFWENAFNCRLGKSMNGVVQYSTWQLPHLLPHDLVKSLNQ